MEESISFTRESFGSSVHIDILKLHLLNKIEGNNKNMLTLLAGYVFMVV